MRCQPPQTLHRNWLAAFVAPAFSIYALCNIASGATLQWFNVESQIGDHTGNGVAVDDKGYSYLAGSKYINSGSGWDIVLRKYAPAGNLVWEETLSSPSMDLGIALDGDGLGNLYLAGCSVGNLGGVPSGHRDVLLARYTTSGELIWTAKTGSSDSDQANNVFAGTPGSVFLTGGTSGSLATTHLGGRDAFVSRFDEDGNHIWSHQFGTQEDDSGYGVASNALGDVFVTGVTGGSLAAANAGGGDAFLAKFDCLGNLEWIQQYGGEKHESFEDVAIDEHGSIYAVGRRYKKDEDSVALVHKYDSEGGLLWTRELTETGGINYASVDVDANGRVYAAGYAGDGDGQNADDADALLGVYSTDGDLLSTFRYGTRRKEVIPRDGLAIDGKGSVYLGGTQFVREAGDVFDLFLMKISIFDGDFNGDGAVDGADLLDWQRATASATYSATELRAWESQFGSSVPPSRTGANAVPEPAAALLAILLLATLPGRPRSLAEHPRWPGSATSSPSTSVCWFSGNENSRRGSQGSKGQLLDGAV